MFVGVIVILTFGSTDNYCKTTDKTFAGYPGLPSIMDFQSPLGKEIT
jgi:hypothetical protein